MVMYRIQITIQITHQVESNHGWTFTRNIKNQILISKTTGAKQLGKVVENVL